MHEGAGTRPGSISPLQLFAFVLATFAGERDIVRFFAARRG
jgi:hypothetical protein